MKFRRHIMTRHTITEDFDNRDVVLSAGDIVILLENDRYGEKGYGGDKYNSGLEKAGGYYHVMVKTRHGRKVRIPRHILSKDCVQFHCQLCPAGPMTAYREYVDHMIDAHLRVQLLRGLDMTKKTPACPFPSCHGISWPIVDNLLFHYASHHNVLEKVVMYESEIASREMRDSLKAKEDTIQSLTRELEELKKKGASHQHPHSGSRDQKESLDIRPISELNRLRDDIQGAREMREIMDQIKEENESLKHKLSNKSSVIKSLKEDQAENKKDLKEIERKYEHECRIVQSLKNELRTLDAKCEAATAQLSQREKRNDDRRSSSSSNKDHRSRVTKVGEDGVSSSGVTSPRCDGGQEASLQEIKSLKEQLDVLKAQNESLRLEIENLQMQNDNLKNIIEIGKSTVETAKKISQDLAEENKAFQEKEGKLKEDLKSAEGSLASVKAEVSSLQEKLEKSQQSSSEEVTHITGLLKSKEAEVSKLTFELSSLKENLKQEENSKILTELKRDDIRSKLAKCRENCRTVEESKKSLENDYKALIAENKNAAAEIKTLKSHLSSSRAIVVEKAVAKDEINKIKSELTSKTIEVEKSSIKLKKLGQQLSTSASEIKALTELKTNHEAELKDLREKVKSNRLSPQRSEAASKLKAKEAELSEMASKMKGCESAKTELQERLDFYIQQCSEFEKNDSRHQDEITILQNSIKTSTMNHSSELDKYKESIQTLENAIVAYKDQVDNLVEQNNNLKRDVQEARSSHNTSEDKDLVTKYKAKCDAVEELLKKQEKVAAQLRRKDWEIANYQKKLDTAFEAGMTIGGAEDRGLPGKVESGLSQPVDDSPVLDLSTRKKEDTNNNKPIKTEKMTTDRSVSASAILRTRKYSELSDCSNNSDSNVASASTASKEDAKSETPGTGLKRSNSNTMCSESKKPSL